MRDLTVGLDPSLTGYGIVLMGDVHFHDRLLRTAADGDTYALRLQQIQDMLIEVLTPERDRIGIICMERPAYNASGAFTGGLVHAATALALLRIFGPDDTRITPVLVASTTLKKFVTGNGAAKGKGLMVKHVYKKWGYDTDDDNLADAYGLARLGAAVLCGTSEHKYERDCIDTVRRSMTWEPLPPQPGRPTSNRRSPSRGQPVGSTSSARAPRKSSSVSEAPATSSNSRRASRSRSRTAAG